MQKTIVIIIGNQVLGAFLINVVRPGSHYV